MNPDKFMTISFESWWLLVKSVFLSSIFRQYEYTYDKDLLQILNSHVFNFDIKLSSNEYALLEHEKIYGSITNQKSIKFHKSLAEGFVIYNFYKLHNKSKSQRKYCLLNLIIEARNTDLKLE